MSLLVGALMLFLDWTSRIQKKVSTKVLLEMNYYFITYMYVSIATIEDVLVPVIISSLLLKHTYLKSTSHICITYQ